MKWLLPLLLPILMAGCGSQPGVSSADDAGAHSTPAGEYVAWDLPGPFGAGDRLRATLRDGELSFSATCNTMSGRARVADGVLEVGPLGGTEMGCPGAGQEQDEWLVDFFTGRPVIEVLEEGFSLRTEDGTLRFLPPDAVPDPPDQLPLEGTLWRLTGIETTDGDTVSMTTVGRVRADLRVADRTIDFDNGCNDGSGDVDVEPDRLRLRQVVTTTRGCPGPRAEVEDAVMKVLGERVVEWSVAGDQLRLTGGADTLVYERG